MGQISEFSLILAALGLSLGHIDQLIMSLITLVGLITIGLSTYMIVYNHWLYERLAPALRFFSLRTPRTNGLLSDAGRANTSPVDTIVFGLGRYGGSLVQEVQRHGRSVLGVDFDPERVRIWHQRGLATLYGDLEDAELFHALPLADAQWIVSTIPERDKSLVLLHVLKHNDFAGRIALTADTMQHREILLAAGADVVLLPFRDAAAEAAHILASNSKMHPEGTAIRDE